MAVSSLILIILSHFAQLIISQPTPPPVTPLNTLCSAAAGNLDVIFLVDTSCGLAPSECVILQEGISDLIATIKQGAEPRVAYIEWSEAAHKDIYITLDDVNWNNDAINDATVREEYADFVSRIPCYNATWPTDVGSALHFARNHFEVYETGQQVTRNKRIVLINGCVDDSPGDPCDALINGDLYVYNKQIEVTLININDFNNSDMAEPLTYLNCLTTDEPERLFAITDLQYSSFSAIFDAFATEVCEPDTGHPTTNPTINPTQSPITSQPTTSQPTTATPSQSPITNIPTSSPIISNPTTNSPTTLSPTAVTTAPTSITGSPTTITPGPTAITSSPTADTPSPTTITESPTFTPTPAPTNNPTPSPTTNPTPAPTSNPTVQPSESPITPGNPTQSPTDSTSNPSKNPTSNPTKTPTLSSSTNPTIPLTTIQPTSNPSISPSTTQPSITPATNEPTTSKPTPVIPTTANPSVTPSTYKPTNIPTLSPSTLKPTAIPSISPTTSSSPTSASPTTSIPTISPNTDTPTTATPTTKQPTKAPSVPGQTAIPTLTPTTSEPTTTFPTAIPTDTTSSPTLNTPSPTDITQSPTAAPTTNQPTTTYPTNLPTTSSPTTMKPTSNPTKQPTRSPLEPGQTHSPTNHPITAIPTTKNPTTTDPTKYPTKSPITSSPTTTAPTTISSTTTASTRSPLEPDQTHEPTTYSPTTNEPTTAPIICDKSCQQQPDNDGLTIRAFFWFPTWIMYDLENIECFLYNIFIKYFTDFSFVDEFDICDIEVIVHGGQSMNSNGESCNNPPCFRNSNTRRLLQTDAGNVSISIISENDGIYLSMNNLSFNAIQLDLQTQFDNSFGIDIDVMIESSVISTTTEIPKSITTQEIISKIGDTEKPLADESKSNDIQWNEIGYLIIAICIVLSILFYLFGLVYHGNKKGSDLPNYLSMFIFFISTTNLYTMFIFVIVLFTFKEADEYNLFMPAGGILILTHIACITLEVYFMAKLNQSKLYNPKFQHNTLLLISTILFGFYATADLLTSKLFYRTTLSLQLSRLQKFKIAVFRIIHIGLLQVGVIMVIQILWFLTLNASDKYNLFVFVSFCLNGLLIVIILLSFISKWYLIGCICCCRKNIKLRYKILLRSTHLRSNHLYSHKLISKSFAKCLHIDDNRQIETISIRNIESGYCLSVHIEITVKKFENNNKFESIMDQLNDTDSVTFKTMKSILLSNLEFDPIDLKIKIKQIDVNAMDTDDDGISPHKLSTHLAINSGSTHNLDVLLDGNAALKTTLLEMPKIDTKPMHAVPGESTTADMETPLPETPIGDIKNTLMDFDEDEQLVQRMSVMANQVNYGGDEYAE